MKLPSRSTVISILRRGEAASIYATVALLFVVEFCFVYWLYRIPVSSRQETGLTLIVLPPWYQRPRFEVTLLLTVVAGLLFSVCRALWSLREACAEARHQALATVRDRVKATLSVAILAGCELFLAAWLHS
ncbi:MAG: hypothetical protein LC114_01050 [Bryobacterales bacterium]|nr:hypothetical protein [Bryobacterales bacterium]